jgi:hypothetical protein
MYFYVTSTPDYVLEGKSCLYSSTWMNILFIMFIETPLFNK